MPKPKSKKKQAEPTRSPLLAWAALGIAAACVVLSGIINGGGDAEQAAGARSSCITTVSGHACIAWGENEWELDPESNTCEQVDGLDRRWCFHSAEDWDYCECDGGADHGDGDAADGGATSLRQAAAAGDAGAVRRLVAAGDTPNMVNEDGDTILMLAARAGKAAVITALIDAGAVVNAKENSGFTALMSAASEGHTDAVNALLEGGADVDLKEPNVRAHANSHHNLISRGGS